MGLLVRVDKLNGLLEAERSIKKWQEVNLIG
jgi:hypothetical protein